MRLTSDQRRIYREQGYLLLPALFDPGEVAEMRAETDQLVCELVNVSIALGERAPRIDLQRRDGETYVRKIQPVVDRSEVFAAYASDERLVGPLRSLLGCEAVLMEEKLNCKQALPLRIDVQCGEEGESFRPHTDWAYFRRQGYPPQTLSSALVIDEFRRDNGPIRVMPGSHTTDWPEEDEPPVLVDGVVSDDDFVDVLAPEGSLLVFHSKLVHTSSENRSGRPRRVMIFSHYPATHRGDPDRRNRPLRERSREAERRYRELVGSGAYEPTFALG